MTHIKHITIINCVYSIGAIAALELTIRSKAINDDILVVMKRFLFSISLSVPSLSPLPSLYLKVAGDMIFDQNFSIEQLLDYFKHKVILFIIINRG